MFSLNLLPISLTLVANLPLVLLTAVTNVLMIRWFTTGVIETVGQFAAGVIDTDCNLPMLHATGCICSTTDCFAWTCLSYSSLCYRWTYLYKSSMCYLWMCLTDYPSCNAACAASGGLSLFSSGVGSPPELLVRRLESSSRPAGLAVISPAASQQLGCTRVI